MHNRNNDLGSPENSATATVWGPRKLEDRLRQLRTQVDQVLVVSFCIMMQITTINCILSWIIAISIIFHHLMT